MQNVLYAGADVKVTHLVINLQILHHIVLHIDNKQRLSLCWSSPKNCEAGKIYYF